MSELVQHVKFCQVVRNRSAENRKAVCLLFQHELMANVVGVLRQEIDSLIRVFYLAKLDDDNKRDLLINEFSISDDRWIGVSDNKMMKLAVSKGEVWIEEIYNFGCRCIHLTKYHGYEISDPIDMIDLEKRDDIIRYLRLEHKLPANPKYKDIVLCLPGIFDKIAKNLEGHLKVLESKYA